MNKNDTKETLEQFVEKHYGKQGTPKRDELEAGYAKFKENLVESGEIDLDVPPMPLSDEDKQLIHDTISAFKKNRQQEIDNEKGRI